MTARTEAMAAETIRINWRSLAESNLFAALEAVELAQDKDYRIEDPAHVQVLKDAELIDEYGKMHDLVREALLQL